MAPLNSSHASDLRGGARAVVDATTAVVDIVEQMHQEMLNSMNRLEIQLLSQGATGEARAGKPASIPDGYQEAVADYYRRLSKPR